MKHTYFVPVSLKIYSICLIMLFFLIVVAIGNYTRMTIVKDEVTDVAKFITPINKNVTETFLLSLEQEVLFERALRLTQTSQSDPKYIKATLTEMQALNKRVDDILDETMTLAKTAVNESRVRADIIAFARISPELQILKQDHRHFHTLSLQTLAAAQSSDQQKTAFLVQQLQDLEVLFNSRTNALQTWLADFAIDSVTEIQRQDQALLWFNGILSGIAILIGLFIAQYTSRKVVTPLNQLIAASELTLQDNFDQLVPVTSHDEIGELTDSFNNLMKELKKKESLRASFQEYIDPRIVKLLAQKPDETKGMTHRASVLFSDMARFSKLSETLSPEALVAVINEHYHLAGNAILKLGGMVDKYAGDAIVAYWSPPFVDDKSHARLACRAALKQLEQIQQLRRTLPDLVGIRKGLPDIDIRIGVATGNIIAGNIGTPKTRSFSIMGEPLTLAEALEQANKMFGTHILVMEETRNNAGNEFLFRLAGVINTDKGRKLKLYELCGYREEFSPQQIQQISDVGTIIRDFFNGEREGIKDKLQQALKVLPEDALANFYLERLIFSENNTPV